MAEQIAEHQVPDANLLRRLGQHRRDHDHVVSERAWIVLPLRPLEDEVVGKHDEIVTERLRRLCMRAKRRRFHVCELNSEFHFPSCVYRRLLPRGPRLERA
jgi:hypothetical protein